MSHSLPWWVEFQTFTQYHTIHILWRKITYWGWVTHISISKLAIIGWFNDLSPVWYLHVCWLIIDWTLWEIFGLIYIKMTTIFIKKNVFICFMLSAKWCPCRLHHIVPRRKSLWSYIPVTTSPGIDFSINIHRPYYVGFNTFPQYHGLHLLILWHKLTHWGWDKMATIFQTAFSNAFSWMKMNEFRLGFHWSLFLRFELTIFHHWFR